MSYPLQFLGRCRAVVCRAGGHRRVRIGGLSGGRTASRVCRVTTEPRYRMQPRRIAQPLVAGTLPNLRGLGHGEVVGGAAGCKATPPLFVFSCGAAVAVNGVTA